MVGGGPWVAAAPEVVGWGALTVLPPPCVAAAAPEPCGAPATLEGLAGAASLASGWSNTRYEAVVPHNDAAHAQVSLNGVVSYKALARM